MNSYSETEIFPGWTLSLLEKAQVIVQHLSDGLRCHEVARIVRLELCGGVAGILRPGFLVEVCDGHYCYVEHSWLLLGREGHSYRYILDVYAVGRLPQVQLLIPDLKHADLFRPGPMREDIRDDVVEAERTRLHNADVFTQLARIM